MRRKLSVKGCTFSIYNQMYNLYKPHQAHESYIYIYKKRERDLISYIVLCQEENKNILIHDIDDQNITYVYVLENTFMCMHILQ